MTPLPKPLLEHEGVPNLAALTGRYEPAVLRGLARDWPAVQAARRSDSEAFDYMLGFDRGVPVDAFVGPAEIGGRFFYRPDMGGFNFERKKGRFGDVARFIRELEGRESAPSAYVGAAPVAEVLPGFESANRLSLLDPAKAPARIWIGNETVVSTHFDLSDNIAVAVAGRRRFTLFPPDQAPNLYVGPLDFTMAGQPASLVPVRDPDPAAFPRFADALAKARTAELEPGDALYIPALWWHNVEALKPLNILVNYWWDDVPAESGAPFEAMIHAVMAVAPLPAPRRQAWRGLFDHYVFRPDDRHPAEHLRPEHRGILGDSSPALRERIRQFLLRGLGRR
jgi:Cupin-like domain